VFIFIDPVDHVIEPVEIEMGLFRFVPFWLLVMGLIVMWFLWFLSCVDLDFIFDFSVDVNPVLLVGVYWSKVDVGNIVGLSIAVVTWIAIITRVAIIARLFGRFMMFW